MTASEQAFLTGLLVNIATAALFSAIACAVRCTRRLRVIKDAEHKVEAAADAVIGSEPSDSPVAIVIASPRPSQENITVHGRL